jgi:hypothetical protein
VKPEAALPSQKDYPCHHRYCLEALRSSQKSSAMCKTISTGMAALNHRLG